MLIKAINHPSQAIGAPSSIPFPSLEELSQYLTQGRSRETELESLSHDEHQLLSRSEAYEASAEQETNPMDQAFYFCCAKMYLDSANPSYSTLSHDEKEKRGEQLLQKEADACELASENDSSSALWHVKAMECHQKLGALLINKLLDDFPVALREEAKKEACCHFIKFTQIYKKMDIKVQQQFTHSSEASLG